MHISSNSLPFTDILGLHYSSRLKKKEKKTFHKCNLREFGPAESDCALAVTWYPFSHLHPLWHRKDLRKCFSTFIYLEEMTENTCLFFWNALLFICAAPHVHTWKNSQCNLRHLWPRGKCTHQSTHQRQLMGNSWAKGGKLWRSGDASRTRCELRWRIFFPLCKGGILKVQTSSTTVFQQHRLRT